MDAFMRIGAVFFFFATIYVALKIAEIGLSTYMAWRIAKEDCACDECWDERVDG